MNTFLKDYVRNELNVQTETAMSAANQTPVSRKRARHLLAFYFSIQGSVISAVCSLEKDKGRQDALDAINSFSLVLKNSINDLGKLCAL